MWAMSISCISIWTKRSNVHPRPGSRGVTARARSSRPLGRSRGATASLGPPRRCRTLTGHGARGPRRKAKGAATLVKGRVRRAVVSTIYLKTAYGTAAARYTDGPGQDSGVEESHSHLSGQAAIPTAYSNVARALKDLYITDNIVIRIRWVRPAAPLWVPRVADGNESPRRHT